MHLRTKCVFCAVKQCSMLVYFALYSVLLSRTMVNTADRLPIMHSVVWYYTIYLNSSIPTGGDSNVQFVILTARLRSQNIIEQNTYRLQQNSVKAPQHIWSHFWWPCPLDPLKLDDHYKSSLLYFTMQNWYRFMNLRCVLEDAISDIPSNL